MKDKTNSGGFVPIMILILVVLTLVGGAYYFGTLKNKTAPSPIASAQPSSSPTGKPTADSTASWKTYTNKTYGISFNYPKEAKIMGDIESQLFTIVSGSQLVSFLVFDNPQGYSASESLLRTISPDNPNSIRKYVTFSNASFNNLNFVLANQDPNYFSQQSTSLDSYLIGKGNYVFSFGFSKTSQSLVTQILSTFEFTK